MSQNQWHHRSIRRARVGRSEFRMTDSYEVGIWCHCGDRRHRPARKSRRVSAPDVGQPPRMPVHDPHGVLSVSTHRILLSTARRRIAGDDTAHVDTLHRAHAAGVTVLACATSAWEGPSASRCSQSGSKSATAIEGCTSAALDSHGRPPTRSAAVTAATRVTATRDRTSTWTLSLSVPLALGVAGHGVQDASTPAAADHG